MKKILSLLFFIFILNIVFCQKEVKNNYKFFDKRPNKGKIFTCFGWNGAKYSNSDIHFSGESYDFTLYNVKATDRQSPFSFELYFGPTTISIPQYNYKLGYFFHENYFVSINMDHMKYVMVANQNSKIDGFISNTGTVYDNNYTDNDIKINPEFLKFEHTDGLNYLNIEINRFDNLLNFINLENKWVEFNISEGISAGIVIPRTNVTLLNKERNDNFYLSGYGISANADLNLTFMQHFFVQYGIKGGFINLPSVHTTSSKIDKANHSFWFFQYAGTFGYKFNISK